MPAEAPRPERDEAFLHNAARIADQFDREEQPLHAATVRFILARFAQAERRAEKAERVAGNLREQAQGRRDQWEKAYKRPLTCDPHRGSALEYGRAQGFDMAADYIGAALTAAAKGTGAT